MPGIVVGIDGSKHARQALEWAVKHAAAEKAPLTVLTVHPVAASPWLGNPIVDARDQVQAETARQGAQEALDEVIKDLDVQPSEVTVRAASGFPAQVLIEASKDADLIVVGSRGIGGFTGLLTGSVSFQLVNHAACPVVVVRH
jgi:nucleotide-binding universal stress UspA family protein